MWTDRQTDKQMDGWSDRHNEANSRFRNFVKVPEKQITDCCYTMLQYKSGVITGKDDLQANKTLPNLTHVTMPSM